MKYYTCTPWINLENLRLHEGNQSQKTTKCMIPEKANLSRQKVYEWLPGLRLSGGD